MRKPFGKIVNESDARKLRRKLSIRKKVNGSAERPRVCVTRSNKHINVQIVDDEAGKTLFSVATFGKNGVAGAKKNKDGAKQVGAKVAEGLKTRNIETAVFDRAGLRYHGVVAALADGIRENGIKL